MGCSEESETIIREETVRCVCLLHGILQRRCMKNKIVIFLNKTGG